MNQYQVLTLQTNMCSMLQSTSHDISNIQQVQGNGYQS